MDPPPRDKLGGDPIEIAGLFEGDIAGVSSHDMALASKSLKSGIKVSLVVIGFHLRILRISVDLNLYYEPCRIP